MSHGPRLWVIDPSLNEAEDQGVAEIAELWGRESRVFQPAMRSDGPTPADLHDIDAVVLMGSAASVYDDLPWLRGLRDWLRPIVDGSVRRPLLGICFGHQLIAEMAGAPVTWLEESRAKRVGIETSTFAGSRLVPEGGELRVVVSHRETVAAAPEGFRVTATRPGVPFDGLEHEALEIYTYQFHPEARDEFAGRAGIDPKGIDARLREDSRRVLAGFFDRCGA